MEKAVARVQSAELALQEAKADAMAQTTSTSTQSQLATLSTSHDPAAQPKATSAGALIMAMLQGSNPVADPTQQGAEPSNGQGTTLARKLAENVGEASSEARGMPELALERSESVGTTDGQGRATTSVPEPSLNHDDEKIRRSSEGTSWLLCDAGI